MRKQTSFFAGGLSRASVLPIGFALLVGFLALAFNLYATHHLPAEFKEQEVQSNMHLRQDALEFSYAAEQTRRTGQPQPIIIGDFIDYPSYIRSPSQPRTGVYTTEQETITIENHKCAVCGSKFTYDTSAIIFNIDYNFLQNDLVYGFEYGHVFSAPERTVEGDKGVVKYDNQTVVNNTTITLYTLPVNQTVYSPGGVTAAVTRAGSKTTLNFTDNGSAVIVKLPTELPESVWRKSLKSELTGNGGHIKDIRYENYTIVNETNESDKYWPDCPQPYDDRPHVACRYDDNTNYVVLEFERGPEYTLQLYPLKLTSQT